MLNPADNARQTLNEHAERAGIDTEGKASNALYHFFRDLIDLADSESDRMDIVAILEHAQRDAAE